MKVIAGRPELAGFEKAELFNLTSKTGLIHFRF